jgi:hypothetical protein
MEVSWRRGLVYSGSEGLTSHCCCFDFEMSIFIILVIKEREIDDLF